MLYLLDTDTCSYVLRDRPAAVRRKFDAAGAGNLAVSAIVAGELRYGAARHPEARRIHSEITDFLSRLTVLAWDEAASLHYGEIRAHLEKRGTPIGNLDLLIAAHARSLGATLVTNNGREFRRVPGLKVDNWYD